MHVSVIVAFYRANSRHVFRESILRSPMPQLIADLANADDESKATVFPVGEPLLAAGKRFAAKHSALTQTKYFQAVVPFSALAFTTEVVAYCYVDRSCSLTSCETR